MDWYLSGALTIGWVTMTHPEPNNRLCILHQAGESQEVVLGSQKVIRRAHLPVHPRRKQKSVMELSFGWSGILNQHHKPTSEPIYYDGLPL